MTEKSKYDVVSVDISNDPSITSIEWSAITPDSSQLCPYVVLKGPIFDRLCGYHLIRKDLNFAQNALLSLKGRQESNRDTLIEQCLWFASCVSYAKCFTSAEGRGVKLEQDEVYKGANEKLLETHKLIMHERHEYISHSGNTAYEISNTMLALTPDENNKELFGLYHSMELVLGIQGERINDYVALIEHVKAHIEVVLDKLFPAALKEVKKTNIDEWYRVAEYPMRDIQNRSNEATLSAPTGGVLRKVFLKVEIQPESGGVLVYGAPNYNSPRRFDGPISEGEIITTEPKVYFQKINGAESLKIFTLGWEIAR